MPIQRKLAGVIPALVTPLQEDGSVDLSLLEKQVLYLSVAGVHGFFINGSTGEGPYLTTQEKLEIFKRVKDVSEGKQFLCAACLQPSTSLAIEDIRQIESLEPDYIVAVTPFYYGVSQDIIKEHYYAIAEATDIPVILYDIPQCTYNEIGLETTLGLASSGKFAGLKDSSGDFISFSRAVHAAPGGPDFSWIQGDDLLDGQSLFVGADGIVTGLGNVWIDPYIRLYQAKENEQFEELNEIQKEIEQLFEIIKVTGGKVIPAIQAGTSIFGRSRPYMKIPGMTLTEDEIAKIRSVLENLELL